MSPANLPIVERIYLLALIDEQDRLRECLVGEGLQVAGRLPASRRDIEARVTFELADLGLLHSLVEGAATSLVERGYMVGCLCGCSGDFEITEQGLAALVAE